MFRKACFKNRDDLSRSLAIEQAMPGKRRMIDKRIAMAVLRYVCPLILLLAVLFVPAPSFAQIGVSVTIGPPALPVYDQTPCPGEGYLWTPGYWAYDYDDSDYYWVPGTWVMPPAVGVLWTPGYWGWGGAAFIWHEGYWGPRVGFYGGISYGFGYFGTGFEGGRWDNGHFFYNRSVTNVNVTNIHNVYNTTVVHNTTVVNRVSYNGGNGGVEARPTQQEEAAARERHEAPVAAQTEQVQAARHNRELRASVNQGKPPVAATARPGDFKGREVVQAKAAGAPYHPPERNAAGRPENNNNVPRPGNATNRGEPRENNVPRPGNASKPGEPRENNVPRPGNENRPAEHPDNNVPRPPAKATHPNDLPSAERPTPPNTGNTKLDKKYQQQQEKLYAKQQQERQKLQQRQDQEHQRMQKQNADEAKQQQLEQRHQRETEQMQQRHEQQSQKLQQKQQPRQKPGGKPPQ